MSDAGRLQKRLDRERRARKHAEALIEDKSRQLYDANNRLEQFNEQLEQRVQDAVAEIRAKNAQLERRVQELAALNSVSTALCTVMDIEPLLDRVISVGKEVMHAEAASLLLIDEAAGQLAFHVTKGDAAHKLRGMRVQIGQGIAGHVAESGKPELVRDVYKDPRFDPSYDEQSGVRTLSLLAVPVVVKGKVVGVAEVINKIGGQPFDTGDLSLFESLVNAAAVALENARLFTQKQAMADDLREALESERRLAIEKAKMGAYIPDQLVDEISRNREQTLALGGKNVEATMLFSDLKGFTRLSEFMDPQRLVAFLNTYMTAMTEVIKSSDGIVDKFLGDGIMAVFTGADHPGRAVHTGIHMQERLSELRSTWEGTRPELMQLQMRIGINTGEVVAGNIGSQTRMDYTVVGDDVNVAARIESVCTPGEIFISESTHAAVSDAVNAEKMEPIQVRNRQQPVQLYAIRPD